MRNACVAAAQVKGQRVDLPDLGLSALLLEGTYPQPHMRGPEGTGAVPAGAAQRPRQRG